MNHKHRQRPAAVLLLALLLGPAMFTGARAEDAATPPAPADTAPPRTASKPADAAKPTDPARAPGAPGAKPAVPPATQQRFTPSERVRADFPVSFPVDI